jgi:multiple sugar transport system substrate-binding protein
MIRRFPGDTIVNAAGQWGRDTGLNTWKIVSTNSNLCFSQPGNVEECEQMSVPRMKCVLSRIFLSFFALSLSVLGMSTALAQEKSSKPESLNFYTTPEWAQYVEPALAEFTKQHGIEVVVTVVPYDQLFTQLTSSILGGQTIDVMELDPAWIPELASQGMVLALDDRVSAADLAQYLPGSTDLMTWDGHLMGLPLVAGMPYFFYNSRMLEELDGTEVPTTWADVEKVSRAAMDAGLADHGIFLGLAPLEGLMVYFDVFLKLHGGQWLSGDGKQFVFNSEAGVQAAEYMKHLIDSGVVPRASLETADRDSLNTFLAGRAPFHFNWSFTFGVMRDPARSTVADVVKSALVPGIKARSYSSLGGGGYSVATTTTSEQWAVELAKFATTGQAARNMLNGRGSDIAWAPLYNDQAIFTKLPLLATYVKQVEYGGLRPQLSWYTEFRDNMVLPELHAALLDQLDAKAALDNAQRKAQERLDKAGR